MQLVPVLRNCGKILHTNHSAGHARSRIFGSVILLAESVFYCATNCCVFSVESHLCMNIRSSVCFCTLKPVVQTALCYTSLLCFSSLSRAPHIRSQRKRRNISTKTEMYVKAQTAAHMAQTELVSVCFILVLDSQRNGCDDEYSVISDRVSSCVLNWLKHSSWCGGEKRFMQHLLTTFLFLSELKTQWWKQSVSLQARPHGACCPPLIHAAKQPYAGIIWEICFCLWLDEPATPAAC